jgi:5-methylthioadenosine/S-adenosylhomocysteine deaminase
MHTHAAMNLFRGIGADLPLMDWLTKVIWPLEGEFVSPEFVKDGVSLALLEMIKSGTTFYLDMYFFEEYTAEVIKEAGIRAGLGFGILDFPTKVASSPDEYLQRAEEFIKTFKGDKDILPVVAPHAVYTCSPETLKKAFDLAEKYDVPYHIHLAESQGELAQVKEKYGTTPVRHMKNLGLLSERVIAAHMVWLDEEEQQAVAESGTKVAHCPESNLKLGSGIAPVSDYIKKGIKVCLGTDGAASNDNLNMLEEMSTMAKLQKGIKLDPTALSSAQALEIATANGFESVGIKAGRIKEGYDADLIIVDANKPHLQPLYDPTAQLVYSAQAGDIETVIARGKILMENYKVLTLDEEEIYKKALYWKEKILNKLNG